MNARLHNIYKTEVAPSICKSLGYSTIMQVPKLEKIVLSMGIGGIFTDSAKTENAMNALSYIAGQKACYTKAKQSISTFKIRTGMKIGILVTLRKEKMYEFMDRFRNIVLPRMRDFKGFNTKGLNGRAFSYGLKDYSVFPEVREFLKTIDSKLGINITFVCNKNDNAGLKELLLGLGFPFKD